jgi:bifunctional UDP-N-acetylglucosamine pyrophosphorylase/glucosamine-1-phosphate N-acetyltransferase
LGTAVLENPSGYARVLRDADGEFLSLIDDEQADDQQKAVHEILPACYCLKSPLLFQMLPTLKAHRKTGEYRLTDLFALYREAGKKVVAVQTVAGEDVLSVNTRQQLADIDLIMQDRLQRQARDAGVTITSAFNTYLEAGVSIGQDTVIHPFSFIGRNTTIGADCVIGPFARIPRESLIPEYTTLLGTPAADGGTKL